MSKNGIHTTLTSFLENKTKADTLFEDKQMEYVTNDMFASRGDLIDYLSKNFQSALDEFTEKYGFPKFISKNVSGGTDRLDFESDVIEDKSQFGIFGKSIKNARYENFGGGTISSLIKDDKLHFLPVVFLGLHISYEIMNGGSNGMYVFYDTATNINNTMCYDIVENKIYSPTEFITKMHAK